MKKTILTLVASVGLALGAYAQGTVNFANNSSTLVTTNNGAIGNAAVGQFVIGLYAGAAGATESQLTLIGTANISPVLGRFNAGSITNSFVSGGGIGTFQIRGWSLGYANYDAAYASGLNTVLAGKSAVWSQATGNPNDPLNATPKNLFGPDGGFTGLQLTQVPEPSTIALGALGLGSLLFIRRRK